MFLFVIRCLFPKSKSLASIVRSRYGNHTFKIIRKYEKLDHRYRKLDLDIHFLDTCIREELCPTFFDTRCQINDCKLPMRTDALNVFFTGGNNI